MKNDEEYINELLSAWEDAYKKGLLTLWILLSLKDGPKYMDEIMAFVHTHTDGQLGFDEQSMYRTLRRFHVVEMVEVEMKDGNKGPQRKYYSMTKLGLALLQKFVERNILLFEKPALRQLLKSEQNAIPD